MALFFFLPGPKVRNRFSSLTRNAIDCVNKYLYASAISRSRKQTMDPRFAQDNPWIAQFHASRITYTYNACGFDALIRIQERVGSFPIPLCIISGYVFLIVY